MSSGVVDEAANLIGVERVPQLLQNEVIGSFDLHPQRIILYTYLMDEENLSKVRKYLQEHGGITKRDEIRVMALHGVKAEEYLDWMAKEAASLYEVALEQCGSPEKVAELLDELQRHTRNEADYGEALTVQRVRSKIKAVK